MGQTITNKDLEVFRGTFRECMAEETVNMKVYLAWDTQEIFIGNKNGAKIKYGGTKKLSIELASYFTEFKNEIYSNIDSYAANEVSAQVAAAIADFDARNTTALNDLRTEVSAALEAQNTLVDNKLTTINTHLGTLDSSVASLTDTDTTLGSRIDSLVSKVDDLKHIEYISGDAIASEISNLTSSGTLSTFKPKFCTLTSSDNIYGAGILYYYNASSASIASATSGGSSSTKEEKDAGLLISLTSTYTGGVNLIYSAESISTEISSSSFSYNVKTGITDSTLASNLKLTKTTTVSGLEPVEIVSDIPSVEAITAESDNISKIESISYKISGTPKEEDVTYLYTATPKYVNVSVYQPILFGNADSVLSHYRIFGEMTVSGLVPNNNVYLYSPTLVSRITSSGFAVPFTLQSSSKIVIPFAVNGVSNCEYYIYDLGAINDTSMSIVVA